MSLLVYDFECPGGHRYEYFVESTSLTHRCCECGEIATRLLASPRCKLEPFSGDFPGAADKWVRDRESHMARERKNVERHGTYE